MVPGSADDKNRWPPVVCAPSAIILREYSPINGSEVVLRRRPRELTECSWWVGAIFYFRGSSQQYTIMKWVALFSILLPLSWYLSG